MLKQKKIIEIITCIAVVFALLFSVCFIVAESNHVCSGEHCHICQGIQLCRQALKAVGSASHAAGIAALLSFASVLLSLFVSHCVRCFTLVSLRVKLTN